MTIVTRQITYIPSNVGREDLITISEAAEVLQMSKPGVISAIERGELQEFYDDADKYHHTRSRRLLLEVEVNAFAVQRGVR